MPGSRFSLFLSDESLPLDGKLVIFGAPAGYDLGGLAPERVHVVSRFAPDVAAWEAAGVSVSTEPVAGDAALVVMPRARDAARAMVAAARGVAGLVLVDGQKTDGIDSMLKAVKGRVPVAGTLSKAHGKLFWFEGGDFSDWAAANRDVGGFITRPGVFSADGPDKGSRALVAALPALSGRVADLGAGWGFLSRHILQSEGVHALDLVEADAVALDCARRNITDPRARFHWADATRFRPAEPYDTIVMNPPFHVSRKGAPEIGQEFIRAAAAMLKPHGALWLVANRHLPYEAVLADMFREVESLGAADGFKVIHARKPRQTRANT